MPKVTTDYVRAAFFLSLAGLALGGCGQDASQTQTAPPPPTVTVATPTQRVVAETDEYVGRFVAVDSVEVRARVSGYLDAVHFRDGQTVKQGDLLFTIDRRPFEATLAQARATLAQGQANLAFAESDLARAQPLIQERTISMQTFDQRIQAKRVAEANVAAQQAALRQAELDLSFTELRAQVSGRIGDRRVSPGNLVTGGASGATLLATIVSIDPIRFEFTFDEASYIRYERIARQGSEAVSDRDARLPVKLRLIDEKSFLHDGRMDFIDNVVDKGSGTIRSRAEFSNKDGLLTPGMFARIQVPGSIPAPALLVPETAIGTEQSRKFVYVVNAENKAQPKYVVLGQQLEGGLRVIKEGVSADDKVIVNGIARIRPMIVVHPVAADAVPPAPGAGAAPGAK